MTELIKKFAPISLEQMSGVKLMNRTDTKFVTTTDRLRLLLQMARKDYYVQEIDGERNLEYDTTYFDTTAFDMYNQHQWNHTNRQKIRFRTYCISGLQFMEVKTKNNHWRPSYWGIKHRFYASLAGSYKFKNNIKLELRERWQYTLRPEKTIQRWDFDDEAWEDKVRSSMAKNQLRSRFEVSYDKKHAFFTPFASIELYNSWGIEKIRYNIGTDLRLSKQHNLSIYYRYQDMKHVDADDYDPNMHYIGVGYKFKF